MAESCCLCGLILAEENSEYPQWCKEVRALYSIDGKPALSGQGTVDDETHPYRLPVPDASEFQRFAFSYDLEDDEWRGDLCFPFHEACWNILLETDYKKLLSQDITGLFRIFVSLHCWNDSLRWGHNYALHIFSSRIRGARGGDPICTNRSNYPILADPAFDIQSLESSYFHRQPLPSVTGITTSSFDVLPQEIFLIILHYLEFDDVQKLLRELQYPKRLPLTFWDSRFAPGGEMGWLSSLLSPSYSREEQFFALKFAVPFGPTMINLQNRNRIWWLCKNLMNLVYATHQCELRGRLLPKEMVWRGAVSCRALGVDQEGCRELKRIGAPFQAPICGLTSSYVTICGQKVVSGLTFHFTDGRSIDLGYFSVSKTNPGRKDQPNPHPTRCPTRCHCQDYIYFVCCPLGFKYISLGYPRTYLASLGSKRVGVTRRSVKGITGAFVGVDGFRLVRFSTRVTTGIRGTEILWEYPRGQPPLPICVDPGDGASLLDIQRRTFAPASFHLVPEQLLAIKIYCALGRQAGITGFGFLELNEKESIWGSPRDAASFVFLLRPGERLTNVVVLQEQGPWTCHVQFVTNLGRTSEPFPDLPGEEGLVFERIVFGVSDGEFIRGLAGCFASNPSQIHCLGVLSTVKATSSRSKWVNICDVSKPACPDTGIFLGGIGDHGEHRSILDLKKKYRRIHASMSIVESTYRCAGQISGLLFYEHGEDLPTIFGQFTSFGASHDLEDGEEILDIRVINVVPADQLLAELEQTQVHSLTVLTNRRKIHFGRCPMTCLPDDRKLSVAIWQFNAMYDWVECF